jgi:hypothetical protein
VANTRHVELRRPELRPWNERQREKKKEDGRRRDDHDDIGYSVVFMAPVSLVAEEANA